MLWFEAGPTGEGVSYPVKPLDAAVGKGRISAEMLKYALERGLLEIRGKIYAATPENVGIDLFLVRRGESNEAIEKFLLGFGNWCQTQNTT